MIYIFLNVLVLGFFIYYTYLLDKNVKSDYNDVSSFAVSVLYMLVESAIFILILIFNNSWVETITTQVMRIAFFFEGVFLINLSFGFIKLGLKKKKRILRVFTVIMMVVLIFLLYTRFDSITVNFEEGLVVESDYLFKGEAVDFFPWTWFDLYQAIFRFALPIFCFISMFTIQEERGLQLEKYQSVVIGEGLILMWLSYFAINFISAYMPEFSLLYMYPFLFLVVIIYSSLTKTVVPSGKGILVSILKSLICYIVPAFIVGFAAMKLQPVTGTNYETRFIVFFVLIGGAVGYFALFVSKLLSTSTKFYTADYESALEKDLASIEYTDAEMDAVTARMNEVIRKNVEASSMNVFILNNQNELETAYSSNNLYLKIPSNNPIFDTLLNINKSVVIWSELEKSHNVSAVKTELTEFFEKTKSDALFILNEGHNIFGCITFGKKTSGDHYKEYDYNVFVKLYSYFFVFGYYMRNISNKEIIGVVNREIRMSSQIITSIQENIDHLKTNKVDTGYLMVPSHNIGGEFIDMIRLTDNRHLFVVGDLSGKGIAASMNMVILKSIIRTYLNETHDFKQLVVKINNFIRESLRKGTIFAGLFALIDFETDTMYYINCGIPALMLYTQVYNNVIEIQGSGHILGFVKDISPFLSVKTTKLSRGDIIVACTDGMIQSHSLRGEQFGKERLQQAILDNSTYPAQRMAQFSFDGLLKFMSKEMEDDVSLLILKYETDLAYQSDDNSTEEPKSELPEEGSIDIPQNAVESDAEVEETPVVEDAAPDTPVTNEVIEDSSSLVEPVETEPVETEPVETQEPVETPEISDTPELVETTAPEFETPVVEEEKPSDPFPAPDDMPDLSDLDAMLKEAGL